MDQHGWDGWGDEFPDAGDALGGGDDHLAAGGGGFDLHHDGLDPDAPGGTGEDDQAGSPDDDLGGEPAEGGAHGGSLEEPLALDGHGDHEGSDAAASGHDDGYLDDRFTPDDAAGHPGGETGGEPGAGHPEGDPDQGLNAHEGAEAGHEAYPGGEGVTEQLFGADPDHDPRLEDSGWHDDQDFPVQLDLAEPPEPVDGMPWSDPDTLGDPAALGDAGPDDVTGTWGAHWGVPSPADLAGYDGADLLPGADPWTGLMGSEDPAVSSLAQWWAPGR